MKETTGNEFEKDAAIGRLVRSKLRSLNNVPVERCAVFEKEVAELDRKWEAHGTQSTSQSEASR